MKNSCKNYLQLFLATLLMLSSLLLRGQNHESDFSKFLQAETEDASKLIAAYTSPTIKAVSYGMTSGWFNTGKAHEKFGFDIGVTMSAVFLPTSDDYFSPGTLGMKNTILTATTAANGQAPTLLGPKEQTTYTSTYKEPTTGIQQSVSFNGPEGLDFRKSVGFSAVPVPMVQVGIGLPIKGTDLKVRFMPSTTVGASKVNMLGFGILHDIKQHIPGLKLAPIDLSILVAYNAMKGTTSLVNADASDGRPVSKDGQVSYKLNSWVAQAIISKKFSVLTLYGGLGYGSVSTNVDVTGTYQIIATPSTFSIKDPVAINFSNTGVKATLGARFKFGPIYLVGDYTFQKYNALTLGFGVSIR
jgi:hypothetical protein